MAMERIKKYMNKPIEVEIGEDKFMMSPLEVPELPDYLYLIGKLKDLSEESTMPDYYSKFDKNDIPIIVELIKKSLKKSYPDETMDSDWENFIVSNFNTLLGGLMNANTLGINRSHEMVKKLEHLNKLRENASKETPTTETKA